MKKSVKLLTCVSVAVVLVCLLAVSAFALNKKGHFTVNILGADFTGDYSASLLVHSAYTDASFEVTNYTGFYDDGGDAVIDGHLYGVYEDGSTNEIAPIYNRGAFSCSRSLIYTLSSGTYTSVKATCNYNFFATICTLEDSASL